MCELFLGFFSLLYIFMEKKETRLKEERLSKTSSEQAILRAIEALGAELKEAANKDRKDAIEEQISLLREQLMRLRGKDYSELEKENKELKARVKLLEEQLYSVRGKCAPGESIGEIVLEHELGDKKIRLQHKLYKFLLGKYAGSLNELENKTVGEIKGLIDKDDLSLQNFLSDFKPENYVFERNYLRAAEEVYNFVTNEIEYIDSEINVNFWLNAREILSEKIGDDEDLAVFLCSALYALGDDKAEVVVAELYNLRSHAFVTTEFDGKFFIFDPSQKTAFNSFAGKKEETVASYSFKGAKIKRLIYRFNHEKYEQFI